MITTLIFRVIAGDRGQIYEACFSLITSSPAERFFHTIFETAGQGRGEIVARLTVPEPPLPRARMKHSPNERKIP